MIDLTELFKMQEQLDKDINDKHNTSYSTTFNERVVAFLVELGEFANETRCFKYWSTKGPSPKDIQIEEYVDGLHFLLSLGLALDFKTYCFEYGDCLDNLTLQLECVYKCASVLANTKSFESYSNLFGLFLSLGKMSGFSIEDIKEAYYKKNEVNYIRQENNY